MCHFGAFADDDTPRGKNCDISAPPASAGEALSHGTVLRVYPRAKDIDSKYTGCQATLASDGERWFVVFLTEIISGDPVRVWSANEDGAAPCRFKDGKVVQGHPETCPAAESLIQKSMAPGCVYIVAHAIAKHGLGALRPVECEYN